MRIADQEFTDEVIQLDFIRYSRCRFVNCTFVYSGYGDVNLDNCEMINVRFAFNDAAENVFRLLVSMYHGGDEGSRQFVEEALENIRQNKVQFID